MLVLLPLRVFVDIGEIVACGILRVFTKNFPQYKGIPFAALNIKPDDQQSTVNGIVFEVDEAYIAELLRREKEYEMISVDAYVYGDEGQSLGTAYAFSAPAAAGEYSAGCPAQLQYIDVCLEGAMYYGQGFYDEFMRTTWIDDQRLSDVYADLSMGIVK